MNSPPYTPLHEHVPICTPPTSPATDYTIRSRITEPSSPEPDRDKDLPWVVRPVIDIGVAIAQLALCRPCAISRKSNVNASEGFIQRSSSSFDASL